MAMNRVPFQRGFSTELMGRYGSEDKLDGRVEIDNGYLGGERSGGKTGRGSENKVAFIAAVIGSAV